MTSAEVSAAGGGPSGRLVPLVYWAIGKGLIGAITHILAPLSVYGRDRVPRHGGAVLAMNHLHALDAACFGVACPRRVVFAAKIEAHLTPGLGELIRAHGTLAIRRGESDRDGVRRMRETVRNNDLLGMFIEGARQSAGRPGEPRPGAAMVALTEGVPVIPAAVYGSLDWRFGNFQPVGVAFGEPMRFDEYPSKSSGYRAASSEIMAEIVRLWEFLRDMHESRFPDAAPPRRARIPSRLG